MNRKFSKWMTLFLAVALLLGMTFGLTGCTQKDMDQAVAILQTVDALINEEQNSQGDQNAQEDQNTQDDQNAQEDAQPAESSSVSIKEDGTYTSKDEVAAYIHLYGHLPDNYITKNEAADLGWVSSKGNLGKVAPGKSIGGDRFGNYEGLLPKKKGRTYTECDIDSDGSYRGAKRIIFSNDGLIYYTEDHYESFEQLY